MLRNTITGGRLDVGLMRPWVGNDGRTYVTVNAASGLKTHQVQAYGTLRRDEWKHLDDVVLESSRMQLVGIQDLIDNNLVFNITNPLGVVELESHKMGEAMEAIVSLDPAVRSRKDKLNYEEIFTPLPVTHSDFDINLRALEASRDRTGGDLETDSVREATRVVNEKLESMLFADVSFKFGRGQIYSYVNFPDRTQQVLTESWTIASPQDILEDTLNMVQASLDSRHHGPWTLYIPGNWGTAMAGDYSVFEGGLSVRQRLLKIDGIQDIKTAVLLPDDNAVLVEMQTQTVRLLRGMDPNAVQWSNNGGFIHEFKVLAIMAPEIRSDAVGRCGIVHLA